jgi:hypothetical protein
MRRSKHLLLLAAGGLFMLVGAAAAVDPHPQTTDVSAAFSATQARMRTHTCEQGGNTFRVTNAVWRGTSTSAEPRLAGTVVIATRAVLNETTGDGWITGTFRTVGALPVRPARRVRPRSNAHIHAVIDNDNHVDGIVNGIVRQPYGRLLGNLSATIVGSTLAGELGANAPVSPDNSALIFRGGCP